MPFMLPAIILLLTLSQTSHAFSISESQLTQHLDNLLAQRELNHLQINTPEQQLEMELSDLQLTLLAQQGGIARIGVTSAVNGQINLFGKPLQLQAKLIPQLESGLRYTDGALYLVNPRLTRLTLKASKENQALLQPLLESARPALEQGLTEWFASNPIYRLGTSGAEQYARQNLQSVTIHQGRLKLNFKPGTEEEWF